MKVSNMLNKHGKPVVNQFIIDMENGDTFFQSYNKTIVKLDANRDSDTDDIQIILDKNYWDCSVTTGKYRNMFLCETKAHTQKKIDSGVYKLEDLNK